MNEYATDGKRSLYPWFIWSLGALFFFIEYFLRVAPSVIHQQLMVEFHIDAFDLGVLSASFYYAYILMQLPVGVVTDRFGPRKMLIFNTALCAVSCVVFAFADTITIAVIARLIMGFSAAFAFVGTLKLCINWFDVKTFALLAGLTQASGMVGAAVGDAPMSLLFNSIGWRPSMLAFAFLLILLSLVMFFTLKNHPVSPYVEEDPEQIRRKSTIVEHLKRTFSYPQLWLNCLFIGLLYGPTAMFAENWGVGYTSIFHGYDVDKSAFLVGLIFIGLAIGCPLAGALADRLKSRVKVMRLSALLCFILMSIIIYVASIPFWLLVLCYFFYGIFNSGIVASYTVSAELVPGSLSATALGITNMASVFIGMLLVQIVGGILKELWSGVYLHGAPYYSALEYQKSLIFVPLIFLISFILSFFIKETFKASN
ncbi:MFS transporter [Thiotrichales bacterium 19S3-7]|nr:MFS transporter [Thiotrichales bacterium 19S3-7]MCF6802315.1 MFS transporter [Thiotrichales bacterium 19S3-11]